jgi:hypothetical protein
MDTKTEITEQEEKRRGELMASMLRLRKLPGYSEPRYNTEWGTKTALGLYRVMDRIVKGGK